MYAGPFDRFHPYLYDMTVIQYDYWIAFILNNMVLLALGIMVINIHKK